MVTNSQRYMGLSQKQRKNKIWTKHANIDQGLWGPTTPKCYFATHYQPARRRAARERREEQAEATRNVRARVDAIETRADSFDLRLRQLDVRVQYIEQPHRWVFLRGFDCTKLFFQTMENNYAVAKGGFLAALIQEIRDHTAPACEALIEELETHLLEHNGLVMIGLYRTGGVTNDCPDSLLRLQQGLCGSKVSYF